jgi:hypothetical protein
LNLTSGAGLGWTGRGEGPMAKAFAALYALDLPVPIVLDGTAGLRTTWKYDAAADKWSELPDVPMHVERGGSVVSIHSAQTITIARFHITARFYQGHG